MANQNLKKILVVEDEKPLAKAMNLKLTKEGFEVFVAHSAEDGLKIIESEKIDLILLDILLPKMNGIEFLKKLREDDAHKDILIIILSAFGDMEKVADAVERGVYIYLIKDQTKIDDLVNTVKEKLSV
ncbi:response regulator [Candidatus Wolfebacteria bacterium]|nr:response regulator [Candidatus Wolfebacteria bacterium]